MESGPGALPGFKCWRAAANSLCENCQRYLLRLVLWPSKGQTLLESQVEMTCGQQPRISERYPPTPIFSVGLLIGKRPFQDGAMLGK